RRAVAGDRLAAQVFQQRLAAAYVVGEFGAALLGGAQVAVAVAGQLVAAGDDAAHQRRVAFGDPAQREEGGVHLVALEQRQDALDVGLDAALAIVPAAALDVRGERRDLEVVLDVAGHGVADARTRRRRRRGGVAVH